MAGLAVLAQVLLAALIGAIATANDSGFGLDEVPRGLVLAGLYLIPAAVGVLGLWCRRPSLVLGAGLIAGLGSFLAFSGITLVFLIPTVLFIAGAGSRFVGRDGATGDAPQSRGPSGRAWLVELLAIIAVVGLSIGAWVVFLAGFATRCTPSGNACTSGATTLQGAGLAAAAGLAAIGVAWWLARSEGTPPA